MMADPSEPMRTGREAFVALIAPLLSRVDSMTIDEVFVTGTDAPMTAVNFDV